MKKFILLLLGITFTTTSAYGLLSHYKNIPAGIYTCQENGTTCIIHKQKNGTINIAKNCGENLSDPTSKYAPMIKRNKCKVEPDPNKFYKCEFADSTCDVLITPNSTRVTCKNNDKEKRKNLPLVQQIIIDQKVLQFAREGKCQELYTEQTSQGNENKN